MSKRERNPVSEIMAWVEVRARGRGREGVLEQGLGADRGESQRTAPMGATSFLRASATIDATSGTPVADSAESCTIQSPKLQIPRQESRILLLRSFARTVRHLS